MPLSGCMNWFAFLKWVVLCLKGKQESHSLMPVVRHKDHSLAFLIQASPLYPLNHNPIKSGGYLVVGTSKAQASSCQSRLPCFSKAKHFWAYTAMYTTLVAHNAPCIHSLTSPGSLDFTDFTAAKPLNMQTSRARAVGNNSLSIAGNNSLSIAGSSDFVVPGVGGPSPAFNPTDLTVSSLMPALYAS